MNREQRDVILFTGQSGIKIRDSLNKSASPSSKPPISVEKEMQKISGKSFLEILAAPPRIQETLWTETFGKIKKELPSYSGPEKYVFITFHASYYHQRKTEFLSPVDLAELMGLKDRIKMVVVFIDDCYDIYKRLMKEGEMFGHILQRPSQRALLESIANLLSILEWREIEIAFSRKIHQLLKVPLYIMAVKHPSWMLLRLIKSYEEQNIFYLSHPISSIREGAYSRPPGFYDELNEFIKQMLVQDNVILFIPDAIDEKRIKQEKQTGRYVPELLEGWPLPFSNDWLFTPLLSDVKDINPLNPLNFDVSHADDGFQTAVSLLLEGLLERISKQINSRDRSLVEQSKDGVVIYRPYWAASTPRGVEEELKYNRDLVTQYREEKRKTVIINTHEDLAKWRIKSLFGHVEGSVSLDDTYRNALNNLGEDWVNNPDKVSKFLNISTIKGDKEKIRECIEHVLPPEYKFNKGVLDRVSTTLAVGGMLAEHERPNECWQMIIDSIPEEDPFFKRYVSPERDIYVICSAEDLEQKLAQFIKETFVEGKNIDMEGRSK